VCSASKITSNITDLSLNVFKNFFDRQWKVWPLPLLGSEGDEWTEPERSYTVSTRSVIISIGNLLLFLLLLTDLLQAGVPPAKEDIYRIGLQAYIYAYPLVLADKTRLVFVQRFPMNRFNHAVAFPPSTARTVVRPNIDTLYSSAWLDLAQEPIILSLPDTGGRYYLVQVMDAWTETIAVPGKRTTGTQASQFAIIGPNWKGSLPSNLPVIKSSTNLVWIIGRIQTNTPADYANVHNLQKGFNVVPLSAGVRAEASVPSSVIIPAPNRGDGLTPPAQVAGMDANTFFKTFTALLRDNPSHPEDAPFVAELKTIGIIPGEPFDTAKLDPEALQTLERAVRDARKQMASGIRTTRIVRNGWGFNLNIGRYGTDYLTRALTALGGLGALPPEEAFYTGTAVDNSGNKLTGGNRYVLHFDKTGFPPVKAFWSATLYDSDGYFVPNPLNRFGLGDRDPLRYNSDGSLDLFIQQDRPAKELEVNWLPAPGGVFNLSLRLYWPNPEVLNGRWTPPVIRRIE
jgi:hypothetical protein